MMPHLPDSFRTRPLAHRALHDVKDGRPENSRAAVQAAVARGYGIEIDVQLTSDGAAVVFHDYELPRLTGAQGRVREKTWEELASINLKGGKEGVPRLSDILDGVAGRVPLLIEIKDQDGKLGPNVGPLERAVSEAIRGYRGDVAVMSFNPHSVRAMQEMSPDVPRGLTTDPFRRINWPVPVARLGELAQIADYDRVGASFISHNVGDLANPRVRELKDGGATILCWTVRSLKDDEKARRVAHNVTFEGYLPETAH